MNTLHISNLRKTSGKTCPDSNTDLPLRNTDAHKREADAGGPT